MPETFPFVLHSQFHADVRQLLTNEDQQIAFHYNLAYDVAETVGIERRRVKVTDVHGRRQYRARGTRYIVNDLSVLLFCQRRRAFQRLWAQPRPAQWVPRRPGTFCCLW